MHTSDENWAENTNKAGGQRQQEEEYRTCTRLASRNSECVCKQEKCGVTSSSQIHCWFPHWVSPEFYFFFSVITSQISGCFGIHECQPQLFWTPGIKNREKGTGYAFTGRREEAVHPLRLCFGVMGFLLQLFEAWASKFCLEGKVFHPFCHEFG